MGDFPSDIDLLNILKNIQNKLDYTVKEALSIGEISSLKNGELVIHNKSTILGLLNIK